MISPTKKKKKKKKKKRRHYAQVYTECRDSFVFVERRTGDREVVSSNPGKSGGRSFFSRGNEVLPQDTTHLIRRACYQRGSPCQDPAGNWTTRRPPDDRKKTQTAVVWSCFPFIRSGQIHLARHSERGKKRRRTKEEVGRQH